MQEAVIKIEELIRLGRFNEADRILRKIQPSKIARQLAAPLANLARRVNRPKFAIRILNPLIRSDNSLIAPPTDTEKLEYAEALRRVGALTEALDLLRSIDTTKLPQALLYKVFCHFNKWEYLEAIPTLNEYLSSPKIDDYARTVAQVNLAAAYIYVEESQKADELLIDLRAKTKKDNLDLLHGNSLELSAQLALLNSQWSLARSYISQAQPILSKAGSVQSLLVEKWSAITESLENKKVSEALFNISLHAQNAKHWETRRDCDFYIAKIQQNTDLFFHLYWGTPFESYRNRIKKAMPSGTTFPTYYSWKIQKNESRLTIDVESGKTLNGIGKNISFASTEHMLLLLLCRDFYKPTTALSAFTSLFPHEYANATTSINRVHKIVGRLRKWSSQFGKNILIQEVDGSYALEFSQIATFQIPETLPNLDFKNLQIQEFKKNLKVRSFTYNEVKEILKVSKSNAYRIIQEWKVKGLIQDNEIQQFILKV